MIENMKNRKTEGPNEEDYNEVAESAKDFNELIALGMLGELLEQEKDYSYACNVGVWFWRLGYKSLAKTMYEHSIKLKPDAPTYFNLAVCCDDLGLQEEAVVALSSYYRMNVNEAERKSAEELLLKDNKGYLINKAKKRLRQ